MNNRGQMMVFGLMFLLLTVLIFMALIPVFQDSIANARGSDSLNCVSTVRVCNATWEEPCYNRSLESQTSSCLILDIYLPYIIIVVLVMGVGGIIAGRSMGGQQQYPQQYPGY